MTRVLGVDPGSRVTGYGLVEQERRELSLIRAGLIRLPQSMPFHKRIYRIFEALIELLKQYEPMELAIEDLFFAKNARSSLKLGHARGAAMIAAGQQDIPVFEYTPLEIKKSVVGYGRADKEQVRGMVRMMLNIRKPLPLDASDALAAAICHINSSRFKAMSTG